MVGLWLGLLGCTGTADTEDSTAIDADQDGFAALYDCDDGNAAVYPTADELCDGIDNNCDGVTDDASASDAPMWYADADGDGHGNPDVATKGCTPPPGFIATSGDCDDADSAANPSQEETCDGIDNDCDGDIDNDPIDATTWHYDADGDQYGVDDKTHIGCAPSADWATAGGDCDDTVDAVYPDAEEICGDGWVNDCNSTAETVRADCFWPDTVDAGSADVVLSPNGSDGQPGWSVSHGDINADGHGDLLVGAPGADRAWMMFGPITADRDYTTARALRDGDPGLSILAADVNQDGFVDVLTGGESQAWVVWGPLTAGTSLDNATAQLPVEGAALATVAAQGDGSPLIAVGAPGSATVVLFDGEFVGDADLDDAWMLWGEANAGAHVAAAGDPNGDGVDELLVGAPNASSGGCAWLVAGPIDADRTLTRSECWTATGWTSLMGAALSGVGDVNGDGYDDVAMGAPAADFYRGAVGIWFGGSTLPTPADVTTADIQITGELGMLLGGDINPAGDLDADGHPDVVIGSGHGIPDEGTAPVNDGPAEAYLFLSSGALAGRSLTTADADVLFEGPQRAFGLRAAGVGDVSGDGRDDLFFSSGEVSEESYLFFGTGE